MAKSSTVYLHHILESLDKIETYTNDLNQQDFLNSTLIQDAVIRNFEIIGEATKNLDMKLRTNYDHIPWKQIAGMRDKLIHEYIKVDVGSVWETVIDIVPSFRADILEILQEIDLNENN